MLALAFVAVYGRVLRGEVPFRRDLLALYAPAKRYLAERLARGEVPSWYPFDGLGSPFLADPLFSTFHPTTLLFLALPFWVAFTLQIVSAPILALASTYRLARRVRLARAAATTAAVAYTLSAYFVGFTEFTYASLAAAALPLLLSGVVAARRRGGASEVALGAGLMLLAGDGHLLLMATLMVVPFLAWRRGRLRGMAAPAGGLALGLLIGAVQVVPALALLPETQRLSGGDADPSRWALTLGGLLNLAWPAHLAAPTDLLSSTYLGLSTVALAGVALASGRARWRWWAPVVLLLAVALGPLTPLWGALRAAVPLWSTMRFPIKALGPATLLVALLAGFGAHRLGRRLGPRRARRAWLLPLVVLADLTVANRHLFATHAPDDSAPSPLADALRARGVRLGGYAYDEAIDGTKLSAAAAAAFGAASDPQSWRAYSRRALVSDVGEEWGLPKSSASLPLSLARRWEWAHRLGQPWIDGRSGLFASRFVILTEEQVVEAGVEGRVAARDEAMGLCAVEYPDALPFAYLAAGPLFCDRADCGAIAASPRFRPGSDVTLEGPGLAVQAEPEPPVAATEVELDGDSTTARIRSDHLGYLVINQAYAEGLAGEVDGHPAPVFAANGLVRAVRVDAGDHRVRITYRAPGLRVGGALSALGALCLLVLVGRDLRSRRAAAARSSG